MLFFLAIAEEEEKVRTLLALDFDFPGLAAVFVGVPFLAFSASSIALALIYLRSQSRTPLKFLCAEQVSLVHGLDSVKSKIAIARAFPESSYTSGSYLGGWSY